MIIKCTLPGSGVFPSGSDYKEHGVSSKNENRNTNYTHMLYTIFLATANRIARVRRKKWHKITRGSKRGNINMSLKISTPLFFIIPTWNFNLNYMGDVANTSILYFVVNITNYFTKKTSRVLQISGERKIYIIAPIRRHVASGNCNSLVV
jgi:hypothetical protein